MKFWVLLGIAIVVCLVAVFYFIIAVNAPMAFQGSLLSQNDHVALSNGIIEAEMIAAVVFVAGIALGIYAIATRNKA